MANHEQIIIKRNHKSGHDEHHGGAWKVAFADFMIALMALFLVLWITSVVDQKERKAIASYMNNVSIFDGNPGSPFNMANKMAPIDFEGSANSVNRHEMTTTTESSHRSDHSQGTDLDSLIQGTYETQEQLAVLAKLVKHMVQQISAQDNVMIEVTPQGLRIALQDDYKQQMFNRGGTELTPFFEDLLLNLAPIFHRIHNPLIISGHTDATPFKNHHNQSNWDLSAERANVARKTLQEGGMPDSRIMQVTGMSAHALINKDDPTASENRRIELFVLTTSAANAVMELFGKHVPNNALDKAKQQAQFNQPVLRREKENAS